MGQVVCRDLWALHLSLLPDPPPAEPYLYERETKGEGSIVGEHEESSDDENEEEEVHRSNFSSDEEGGAIDPELASLLRLNSESDDDGTSNASEPDAQTQSNNKGDKGKRKRGRKAYAYDGPASLVAVLVVACWTMRIGKLYTDFVR